MTSRGDAVADCVLSTFDALPRNAKPRSYENGQQEWVPLSGIVLILSGDNQPQCVSLGTGMRCLPVSKLRFAGGRCLHDWHAEIVAIRAFNCFLMDECAGLLSSPMNSSPFIRKREEHEISCASFQPFAVRDDVQIFMYCTDAPCGDASMELTMSMQDDPSPWARRPAKNVDGDALLDGRGYFSRLGAVRRKPSRGDAPATLSKSCSDKLAMKECTSLLSSLCSVLIHPSTAYLSALVLPQDQVIQAAKDRAFSSSGRMGALRDSQWQGGYSFRPFSVTSTSRDFAFSRRRARATGQVTGSNISAVWTRHKQETLIGGVLQGHKQSSHSGASSVSRHSMWKATVEVITMLGKPALLLVSQQRNYAEFKETALLKARRQVKSDVRQHALSNWTIDSAILEYSNKAPSPSIWQAVKL